MYKGITFAPRFTRLITLAALLIGALSLNAQTFPLEMRLSPDGHMLQTGGPPPTTGLYDTSLIRSVYIDFPQANYWSMMQANYTTRTKIAADLTVDGVTYDSVGVGFKGNTSYNNVQNSQKKSFGVDMEFTHDGQDLMGYKTLNFNNAYEDASFLREVFYLHQIRKHVPAAKANFVHLYLNNADWGLYPNVQQINKDFYEEWFLSNDGANWRAHVRSTGGGPGGGGWGDGTAALNYLGADTALYQTKYTLKSTDIDDPWTKLVAGCNALNNTSTANLPTVLPNFFDIDRTLWFLASENAFSDDDSYIYKGKMDYYVYYEPETGRLVPQEFDGNSVMKTNVANWSPFYHADNANYPLLYKILAIPKWRQRYLAHVRTIIQDELTPANCNAILDSYKTQIDALVNSDPKKIYTYAQFGTEVTVLKNFVSTRRTNLLANTEVAQVAPTIGTVAYFNNSNQSWTAPLPGEIANVQAAVTGGISAVNLYYATGLVGNFTMVQMYDDGAHNDGASGDGNYGAAIPGQIAGTWVRFYVEAVANNAALSVSYSPVGAEHDVYVYNILPTGSTVTGLVINEVMASNTSTVADEASEFEDWIELYNNNNFSIDLSGFYLTDNPANLDKWEFSQGTTIPANGYLVVWADEDSAQGPTNHTNFKLSASGEVVYLMDASLAIVDSITFGAQTTDMGFARVPNGTGPFVIQAPTYNSINNPNALTEDVANNIGIFPNPASTYFRVVGLDQSKPQKVEVMNNLGQVVYTETLTGQGTIYTSDWVNGLYLVRCGNTVKKILIAH